MVTDVVISHRNIGGGGTTIEVRSLCLLKKAMHEQLDNRGFEIENSYSQRVVVRRERESATESR